MQKNIMHALLLVFLALLPNAYAQHLSPWPAPVNVGTANGVFGKEKTDPFLSRDGLSLYFACNSCSGGYGGYDIYVAKRETVTGSWSSPENLGPLVNSPSDDTTPAISIDGHRLYFASNRTGGSGNNDIWVSRRHDNGDDLGWQVPLNLGDSVNTDANESSPTFFEDELTGTTTMYFQSDRANGLGGTDIYESTRQGDESFGPAVLVTELNSPANDGNPSVRRDGLEIFFNSNRDGSMLNLQQKPSVDIWVATRSSTAEPWSTPVNPDPQGLLGINTGKHEGGPELSFDGLHFVFHAAQRVGNYGVGCPGAQTCYLNIWMMSREKVHPQDANGPKE